jgi:hypothetical protein
MAPQFEGKTHSTLSNSYINCKSSKNRALKIDSHVPAVPSPVHALRPQQLRNPLVLSFGGTPERRGVELLIGQRRIRAMLKQEARDLRVSVVRAMWNASETIRRNFRRPRFAPLAVLNRASVNRGRAT